MLRPMYALYFGGMGAQGHELPRQRPRSAWATRTRSQQIQDALPGRAARTRPRAAVPTRARRGARAHRPGGQDPRRPRGVARVARGHVADRRRHRPGAPGRRAGSGLSAPVRPYPPSSAAPAPAPGHHGRHRVLRRGDHRRGRRLGQHRLGPAGASCSTASPARCGRPSIPPEDFALRDQDGDMASLHQYRGQPVILTFMYSTCQNTCPLMADQIRGAMNDLGHDVPALAVSVDPATTRRSTPSASCSSTRWSGGCGSCSAAEPSSRRSGRPTGSSPRAASSTTRPTCC